MDNFLDIRTLSLMMGLVSASFSIGMIYLYLYHKTYSGFLLWSIAAVCAGIGGVLLSLRGYIPPWLSIIFANSCIVLFSSFISWGMEKFTDRNIVRWPDYALLLLYLSSFIYFTYISQNVEARIAIVSLTISIFCLKSCWLLTPKTSPLRSRFLFYTLLCTALWFLLRSSVTLFYPWGTSDFMDAGLFQAFAFIVFITNQILVSIGLILANYQRLEIELTSSNSSLIDSEERYRSLSYAAFEGIAILKDGIVVEANDALGKLLGYQPAELIDKKATDFIAPEERENVTRKILSAYEQPYETSCLRKDGATFPVEIHGKMFAYRDEQVRVTAVRDITDRKEAEKALQQANKKLLGLAMKDGLTQVANRRNFDIKIQNEWRRMNRSQNPLSLIIFDVDHFKLYNDTYGHQAGDLCLKTIADIAAKHFQRPSDLLARYGGEEFAIILPETSCQGATALAEKVRQSIQEIKLHHEESLVSEYVTVSCGVSSLTPTETTSPQILLEIADKALYEAKENGRNKVVNRCLN